MAREHRRRNANEEHAIQQSVSAHPYDVMIIAQMPIADPVHGFYLCSRHEAHCTA
eukprot:m.410617 g.410617  ORF g.410617 m.410617 type:complete len:55 (-) comp21246_c1_seq50:1467-1631(-)